MLRLHIENTLDEENKMKICKLSDIARFTTGKLNSNAATMKGRYPFFTCAPKPLTIDTYAYDTKAVILAGNNAEGNFHIQYYEGKFNAYQRTYIIETNDETIVDIRYLYYALKICLLHFKQISQGTATKFLTAKILNAFELPIPRIEEQQKIAFLLAEIDEKIKTNEIINNNLEQQAQAIFENEFLSLQSLPDGWRLASLIDIADYLNGLAMQKYRPSTNEIGIPVLKIKELRQGWCDDNSEFCSPSIKSDYIIHDGDVIFSWSGSLLVDFWCGGICGLNQHLFKVSSSKYDKWFYYAWTKHHLDRFIAVAADKATTMGHIKRDELAKAEVFIPNEADYNRIGALLQPIYDLIISNRIENKKLAETRDSLLPKLMSGEIDMSEVDYE